MTRAKATSRAIIQLLSRHGWVTRKGAMSSRRVSRDIMQDIKTELKADSDEDENEDDESAN